MIKITDLKGGKSRYINAELVECVESNPDTQILLNNGHRYYSRETPAEIVQRIMEYKQLSQQAPVLKEPGRSPEAKLPE